MKNIKENIKENIDLILIAIVIGLFAIGMFLANSVLIHLTFIVAIIGSALSKSPFTNSKDVDERELHIINKASQNAYKIMFAIIALWYIFSFEKNILNSFDFTIKDSIRVLFAFLYLSFNASYSYYKRRY